MKKALYVLEDGNWNRCEKVELIIHGLGLSTTDEDLDFDWGCIVMGQLMQNTDFANISDVEYFFERSDNSSSASEKIALYAQRKGMGSFVFPEVSSLFKMTVGLIYSTNRSDIRAMLIGSNDVEYFLNNVKVI